MRGERERSRTARASSCTSHSGACRWCRCTACVARSSGSPSPRCRNRPETIPGSRAPLARRSFPRVTSRCPQPMIAIAAAGPPGPIRTWRAPSSPHHACGLNLWHFPHPCWMAESGPGCALERRFQHRATLRIPAQMASFLSVCGATSAHRFQRRIRKWVILVRDFRNTAEGPVLAGLDRLPLEVILGNGKGNFPVSA